MEFPNPKLKTRMVVKIRTLYDVGTVDDTLYAEMREVVLKSADWCAMCDMDVGLYVGGN